MNVFVDRIIRAAKLDTQLYEEVEADTGAMKQAMGIVLLSSLAAGIGTVLKGNVLTVAISALISWYLWACLIYLIGAKLMPEPGTKTNIGELLRTTGFASSPGLARLLCIIPGIGQLILLAASIWMLAAMVVAVRQALDYKSTWRAFWVCFIGWMIPVIITTIFYLSVSSGTAQ